MATSAARQAIGNEPVVSVEWLHANLEDLNLKVLDASWYMPDEKRDPLREYQVAHIPGALFFDIDGVSDRKTDLPHMLPSEEAFTAAVSVLGIHNKDGVVVYDGKGNFSAARVWWMFRVFGHDKVWVLDGGFPLWRSSGYDVESSAIGDSLLQSSAASEAVEKVYKGLPVGTMSFQTNLRAHLVWTLEQIQKNMEDPKFQHVDARAKARFDGLAPEPRKGIISGHIPGSKCVPFLQVRNLITRTMRQAANSSSFRSLRLVAKKMEMIQGDGGKLEYEIGDLIAWLLVHTHGLLLQMLDGSQVLLPRSELAKRFEDEGISLDRPIVLSCGTGVTACIVVLGLHRLGKTEVPVYDGSWTEWASDPTNPVITA